MSYLITKKQYRRLQKYGHCLIFSSDGQDTATLNKKYTENDFKIFGKW